jgi:hypothetical protein
MCDAPAASSGLPRARPRVKGKYSGGISAVHKDRPLHNLPPVESVSGLYFDSEIASLQYRSGDADYVLEFPLDQVLVMEEYFIKLRRQIGDSLRRRKPPTATRSS